MAVARKCATEKVIISIKQFYRYHPSVAKVFLHPYNIMGIVFKVENSVQIWILKVLIMHVSISKMNRNLYHKIIQLMKQPSPQVQ